jgi:hypothetical protein
MKDRNQGEFYVTPVDNTIDIKVSLSPEVFVGERLRDVWTLPREVRFSSPLLAPDCPYLVTELPKSDLSSTTYI